MITSCINALVALTRIGDFLQKPESGLESLRKAAEATPDGHVKVRGGSAGQCCHLLHDNSERVYHLLYASLAECCVSELTCCAGVAL
jgi:hypothetical protein